MKITESGGTIKGWAEAMHETSLPPHVVVGELEVLLSSAFEATQAATHVITGSLKASGKTDTDFDGDEWRGSIEYGGLLWGTPSPGPAHDPVDYAIYEMDRGGDHDFLAPADLVFNESAVTDILNKHFKG